MRTIRPEEYKTRYAIKGYVFSESTSDAVGPYPKVSLHIWDSLGDGPVFVLRDGDEDIVTRHCISGKTIMMNINNLPMTTILRDELSEWVSDFCRASSSTEDYVWKLISQAMSVKPQDIKYTPPPPVAPKIKREPLPVARVIKL